MKECERAGDENVQQQQIVDRLVKDIELNQAERHTSVDRAEETMNKVNNVIQFLITNENVLMISQDSLNKQERYLTLNVNIDTTNLDGFLQG
jgi:hypothetical protein